jgi:GntR family transcriptional regulator, histidine utilization repressor
MSLDTPTHVRGPDKPTLYKQIRRDIERRIMSGMWPPGFRIPFEHELVEQYGCSRMTVSKALSELAQADLIERRRRAGTFVRRPQMLSAVLKVADIRAEIVGLGRAHDYVMTRRSLRSATAKDRSRLGLASPGKVIAVVCCHYADGVPFALEDRVINLDAVPDAASADFSVDPPGTWLLSNVPWTEAEHTISAISADAATAQALAIAERAACLVIERHTWRGDQTLTAVRLVYPGDAHKLVARFKGANPEAG